MKKNLNKVFALKDLGSPSLFFGIKVSYIANGDIHLSQKKNIQDLLLRAKMDNAKPINTHMLVNSKLSNQGSNLMSNPTLYIFIVGALQLTRPEIAFAVNSSCKIHLKIIGKP